MQQLELTSSDCWAALPLLVSVCVCCAAPLVLCVLGSPQGDRYMTNRLLQWARPQCSTGTHHLTLLHFHSCMPQHSIELGGALGNWMTQVYCAHMNPNHLFPKTAKKGRSFQTLLLGKINTRRKSAGKRGFHFHSWLVLLLLGWCADLEPVKNKEAG